MMKPVTRKRIAISAYAVLGLQVLLWFGLGRNSLSEKSPMVAAWILEQYTIHAQEFGYAVNGRRPHLNLVICDELVSTLGPDTKEQFGAALSEYDVSLFFESEAPNPNLESDHEAWASGGYQLFCSDPVISSPLVGRMKSSTWWGGLGANGFDSWYVFVFGKWVHVYSYRAWVA
jgi:hypothetical protein